MRWFIFEDALRDFQGHWFEHITTLRNGLLESGDEVKVFCAADALPAVREPLAAEAALPDSIWHRMGDGAGGLSRLLRIPGHGAQTYRRLRTVFQRERIDCPGDRSEHSEEMFFVPTVLPHHLLGWLPHLNRLTRSGRRKVLFYFLSAPLVQVDGAKAVFQNAPSALLLKQLLKLMARQLRKGQVIVAAETRNLASAMSEASGVPVIYLPQPVQDLLKNRRHLTEPNKAPLLASFGAARWEKGSDVLQSAIGKYLARREEPSLRFAIQWIDDFRDPLGQWVRKDQSLADSGKVAFITGYFQDDEYSRWLGETDAVLLPYRRCAYGLRGSRVLLEAMVAGIPCVTTEDTAPADDLTERGCGLLVKDNDAASLLGAIEEIRRKIAQFRNGAIAKREKAAEYYSVANFKKMLAEHVPQSSGAPSRC